MSSFKICLHKVQFKFNKLPLIIRILLLIVFILLSILIIYSLYKQQHKQYHQQHDHTVILIRTFAGHFDMKNMFNIMTLLASLQAQKNPHWVAYLLNTDTTPLPFVGHPIVEAMNKDHRIRYLNLPVAEKYDYWEAAYELTDRAIAILGELPEKFQWLVITNGDNSYEPRFLSHLNPDIDIFLVGYWSRWWKDEVKLLDISAAKCYTPRLQHGFVDLGGAIMKLPRFIAEGHRFSDFGKVNSQDGLMFTKFRMYSWSSMIIPECLFSHSPSPWGCLKAGGVWFNSFSSWNELSNACLTPTQARTMLQSTFPVPILEKSAAGLQVLTFPEPYHSQRRELFEKSSVGTHIEFNRRMNANRGPICEKIRASGYQVDAIDYKVQNPDLSNMTNEEATHHFWAHGCIEARMLKYPPKGYLTG